MQPSRICMWLLKIMSSLHEQNYGLHVEKIWWAEYATDWLCLHGHRLSSTTSPAYAAYVGRQRLYVRLMKALGKLQPDRTAQTMLSMYDQCESLATPQEIMSTIVEAIGHMVVISSDLEIVKELFVKLYTPRFALHFSDAALCQVAEQIQAIVTTPRSSRWTHWALRCLILPHLLCLITVASEQLDLSRF